MKEVKIIKLLSLDQATTKTGIAIHEDRELIVYDLINLEKKKIEISERVGVMGEKICALIRKNKPDCVVIEDVALQANVSGVINLARLQGIITGYCREHGTPCVILKPSNWRKMLGFKQGRGVERKCLKNQAKEYVMSNYGLKLCDDVCEAICIGDAYLQMSDKKEV